MLSYNEMGILFGLIAAAVVFLVRKKINGPYNYCIWKSTFILFSLYALILIAVEIRWHFIMEHYQSFDLNQNGFIDLDEYSDEAKEALNRVTRDTARNFAFLTAAIGSALISLIFFTIDVVWTHRKIKNPRI